ncbi:GIY-YIG nuclease family protein [Paenibacillus sp. FSL R7-0216]|uniref:GIY-YIG nuclease family protein n=1 Tax=Paenibacillus sp. FSL R7-0216 TaxID=2921677 RepID=UPI0030D9ED0D
MNQGYVYVLYNQSFPDLVKIGMTTRDPENRVTELSGATGVPTPFVLLYKKYYADCHLAEKLVHEHLAKKRLNENREFFSMQPHEAITFIQNLEIPEQHEDYEQPMIINNSHNDIIDSIVKEADGYYFGYDGFLEDFNQAYSLYKKASSFNSGYADFRLGSMHMSGDGCKKDKNMAMNYFKKSASK